MNILMAITKMRLSILAGFFGALFLGIVIGRYAIPSATISHVKTTTPPGLGEGGTTIIASPILLPQKETRSTIASKNESASSSTEQIIESIKTALAGPSNRRAYAGLSQVAESVDEKNVREVIAFAQNLPIQQDKNTLVALLVGRW
ncbi:MAG: hypothetical protein QOI96_1824, partial [Verrucomicrobiota bacterium]